MPFGNLIVHFDALLCKPPSIAFCPTYCKRCDDLRNLHLYAKLNNTTEGKKKKKIQTSRVEYLTKLQ